MRFQLVKKKKKSFHFKKATFIKRIKFIKTYTNKRCFHITAS